MKSKSKMFKVTLIVLGMTIMPSLASANLCFLFYPDPVFWSTVAVVNTAKNAGITKPQCEDVAKFGADASDVIGTVKGGPIIGQVAAILSSVYGNCVCDQVY